MLSTKGCFVAVRNWLTIGVFVAGLGLFSDVRGVNAEDGKSVERSIEKSEADAAAELLLEMVNDYRKSQGRQALEMNEQLCDACDNLSDLLARTGQFSHYAGGTSPSQRARSAGYSSSYVSENLYMQGTPGGDYVKSVANGTLRAWQNSPGHNANLLNGRSSECGISIRKSPSGRVYAVMKFGG